MKSIYVQTFDAITAGEDFKRETEKMMHEYIRDQIAGGIVKEKKHFKWSAGRIAVAASMAAVLVFCAIFFPILALRGKGVTEGAKVKVLAAFDKLQTSQSYTETAEITEVHNGVMTFITVSIKYQKNDGNNIAEGFEEVNGEKSIFYYNDGYIYMPVSIDRPELTYGGVKFKCIEELISYSQFFAQNSGYLTRETINRLSDSGFDAKESDEDIVFSFKTRTPHMETLGDIFVDSDYAVTVEKDGGRILEIKQNSSCQIEGQTVMSNMICKYDYSPVEVTLPQDLDTYIEYTG